MPITKKRPGAGSSGTGKFKYRPRTSEEMQRRAHQTGGSKEGFVKQDIQTWTPKDGDNKIRICPPTWDEATHYGLEVFAHYGIGPDNSSFLCPKKHHAEQCSPCDARVELMNDGDEEGARDLNWKKRVGMWIIDRKEESKGPQLWFAPWTLDQEIAKQSIDESGEVMPLDHPEEGYDVTFTREKGAGNTPPKYVGVKIARRSSPLFDDDDEVEATLKYISENPVPDCLVFHDSEYIQKVFEGKAVIANGTKKTGKPSMKPKVTAKPKDEEPEDEQAEEEPEEEQEGTGELPTWDEVHEMNQTQLTDFAEEQEVDFGEKEFDDLEAVQDYICRKLDIEKPEKKVAAKKPAIKPKINLGKKPAEEEPEDEEEKPKAKTGGTSWKDKLKKFRA
jgi:hypothetical protein